MEPNVITDVSPGTYTSIASANVRMNTADTVAASGAENCLVRPDIGLTNYSYWKSFRLVCTVTPTTLADDLRFYLNSTDPGTGMSFLGAIANVGGDGGYRVATGTIGETGDELTTLVHSGLTASPVDPLDWTSSSPLTLTGSIPNPDTGAWGDIVVLQAVILDTVATGEGVQQEMVWVWDET
jgi:hypothetical protein